MMEVLFAQSMLGGSLSSSNETLREAAELLLWFPYRWGLSLVGAPRVLRNNGWLGWFSAHLRDEEVDAVAQIISDALPHSTDPGKIARQVLAARVVDGLAPLCYPRLDENTLHKVVRFHGLLHIERSRKEGHGCILALPHMGPMGLLLLGLSNQGYPVNRLIDGEEAQEESRWSWALQGIQDELEQHLPGAAFDARGYLRPIIRRLQGGEVAVMAYDGTPGDVDIGRRIVVRLLGREVEFPVGPVYLALRAGVPLHPTVIVAGAHGGFDVHIEPALSLDREGPLNAALEDGAQKLATHLEAYLKVNPGAWRVWPRFVSGQMIR